MINNPFPENTFWGRTFKEQNELFAALERSTKSSVKTIEAIQAREIKPEAGAHVAKGSIPSRNPETPREGFWTRFNRWLYK